MSNKTLIFATCLLALSLNCVLKGGAQKNNNNNLNLHQQLLLNSQQLMQHNNLTAHLNQARPLDRPSLTLMAPNNNYQNQSTTFNGHSLEQGNSPADWFMMGVNEDLLTNEGKNVASIAELDRNRNSTSSRRHSSGQKRQRDHSTKSSNRTVFDDEQSVDSSDSNEIFDDAEEGSTLAGSQKEPECASNGRYYCTYKEDYPMKLVTEVTKYYKWPLEKLFRDLHAQIMPKLAQDTTGNLVCDSITRVVRPGWTRNTNDRWLVVINTENYHQYVTEVVCQYGSNSRCNFIPPCYYSSCQQRYNTQKLLVIDPSNPYRGPFLSEFLFPSCCVCYVPSASDNFQDKYRSSPATIYQRTLQQESANNVYPPQYRPTNIMEDIQAASFVSSQSAVGGSQKTTGGAGIGAAQGATSKQTLAQPEPLGPGEIRRGGDQYKRLEPPIFQVESSSRQDDGRQQSNGNELRDFPRL